MRYVVTGATGLLGTHLTHRLLADGHDVVAVTRDRSNASHLPSTVSVAEADVTDREKMREAMADADGLFHLAAWFYLGAGPREAEIAERINVEGTRNVLELMNELAIPDGVYTSTVGVYPGTSGRTIDESWDPPCPTFSVYHRTKWQAHYEVARPLIEDGLPLTIVLPSGIYGPGDKRHGSIRGIFRNYLTGRLRVIPRGLSLSFDHAADVADAHIRAMERGTRGDAYVVASDARPVADVFACAQELTGIRAPRTVPDGVIAALARMMRLVERVATPPEGYESELLAFAAGRQYPVDSSKARRELGIEHRSLADGLFEYLAWEVDELGLDVEVETGTDATSRET